MKTRILSLLTRWFGAPEEINGGERCPTYLFRWVLGKARSRWWPGPVRGANFYLHRFCSDDWSRDLHDHPKRFISIGLWGSYVEETRDGEQTFRAPWVRSFPPEHTHRLRLARPGHDCWTLVITLKGEREWGFYPDGKWVLWSTYVRDRATDARVNCN